MDTQFRDQNDFIRIQYSEVIQTSASVTSYAEPIDMTSQSIKTYTASAKEQRRTKKTKKLANVPHGTIRYTTIAQILQSEKPLGNICMYGVVVYASIPVKKRDYFMQIKVVDDSIDRAFRINVFATSLSRMPSIQFFGDLVRFRHLKVSNFNGELVGNASSRVSEHLTIRKAQDTGSQDETAFDIVSNKDDYSFTSTDKTRVENLMYVIMTHRFRQAI